MKKNEKIEITIYLMFITGILLWSQVNLSWEVFKFTQILHVLFSLIVLILFLLPFLKNHLKEHKKTILKRKKTYKKRRQTFLGILIGISLLFLLITGVYLFLWGNRGGDIYGILSNQIHFYLSFFFIFLIIYHSYYLGRQGSKKDKLKLEKIFKKQQDVTC